MNKSSARLLLDKLVPEPNTGCWLYDGYWKRIARGYWGRVYRNQRTMNLGRAAYEAFIGPVPQGKHVLHTCDVGVCGNPDHLRLGTHSDNMKDMIVRKRGKGRNSPEYRSYHLGQGI